MCLAAVFSLFGRGKKDKYILDGPDMENTLNWDSFSVSRSGDSYAQHNFNLTVKYDSDGYVVKGSFINGEENEGFALPKSACRKIDELQPHNLPDLICMSSEINDEIEEAIALDVPEVRVEVTYTNGTLVQKVDENDFSIKVYQIVEPYLIERFD